MYEQKMYPLKLVETADYYLLVLDRLVKGSNIIDFAVELYNMIDSIPQVYSSLLKVSSDIYSTLPKMFRNDGIEATEIFNHVSKICAGMESKNYLEKYDINGDRTLKKYTQDKPTSFTIPVSSRNASATFPNISAVKGDPMPFDNQDGFTYSVLSEDTTAQIPFEMLEQPIQEKQQWFILYNSLYEITFVVKHYNDVINALIEDFSDFQLMLEIADITEENVDICKKFFHKKTWVENADALEMVKSFHKLYSIDTNKSQEVTTERDQVFEILNRNFFIDFGSTADDVKKRNIFVKALIKISRDMYVDLYIVGDYLQSISIEDNAFAYVKNAILCKTNYKFSFLFIVFCIINISLEFIH